MTTIKCYVNSSFGRGFTKINNCGLCNRRENRSRYTYTNNSLFHI